MPVQWGELCSASAVEGLGDGGGAENACVVAGTLHESSDALADAQPSMEGLSSLVKSLDVVYWVIFRFDLG